MSDKDQMLKLLNKSIENKMKISRIIRSPLAITRKQGEKVRDRTIKKLSADKRVTLDCGEIICFSIPFFMAVAEIYLIYPENKIQDSVRFINIGSFANRLLKSSINRTLLLTKSKNQNNE